VVADRDDPENRVQLAMALLAPVVVAAPFLNTVTLSPLAWATISAETFSPSVDFRLLPSPASNTSPSVILSPALPSSFSTTILSPGWTRYCFPPVRTTANIGFSLPVEFSAPSGD
jgi:hypothetical protein